MGYEVVWTRYGRKVVSNLMTITGSIEEFLTALLGFHLSWTKDPEEQKNRFIRYEQLAGYLREYANRQDPQKMAEEVFRLVAYGRRKQGHCRSMV